MTGDATLRRLAQAHGVHLDFYDLTGARKETPVPTLRALLAALGVDAANDAEVSEALAAGQAEDTERRLPGEIILRAGEALDLPIDAPCDWVLLDEDGGERQTGRAEDRLALPALPVGYYVLNITGAGWREESFVMARPVHAPLLPEATGQARGWGVTAALYGLRGAGNGGLGNYADLATAAQALGQHGTQFLGINPVSALGWAALDTISPYSPTHRGFFNTDHIAVAGGLGPCPDADLIDYAAFRAKQRPALEAEFSSAKPGAALRDFCRSGGTSLEDFACFEALSERHGPDARDWPADLQTPGATAKKAAGTRAEFHRWLQWRAETQIAEAQKAATGAGMPLGLYLDLAVGSRPGGAEAWMHPETIAHGVTIGAPPDQLSPEGQSWNLVAHAPGRLAAARYAPLRAMLRKLMEKCGLLRIDHALGLMRSYWLPDDGSPGAYITQPFDALLAVVAIEAHKAGCVVVGEDLGLVPPGFRERMNAAGLYSYAVWQYETFDDGWLRAPDDLRAFALACFATHDTPTLRGFWYGTDIVLWQEMGWLGSGAAGERHAQRAHQRASLRRHCDIADAAGPREVECAIHRTLARTPAALVAVQLDDMLSQLDAPNLPGTIDEHPNWRRRCPVAVEDFAAHAALKATADTMAAGDRQPRIPAEKGPMPCPE